MQLWAMRKENTDFSLIIATVSELRPLADRKILYKSPNPGDSKVLNHIFKSP